MRSRAGVEVEFTVDRPLDIVVRSLRNQGLEAEEEGYNHHVRDYWKVTTDSSCGYELVSPILTEATCRSVTPAMRSVADAGGYVTEQCGLHVHIELPPRGSGEDQFETGQRIAGLYHDAYDLLAPMFDEHRHNNEFAAFHEDRDTWLSILLGNRYQAVNLQAIERQGTIEFRQHHGTLDARAAYAWMNVCDVMVHDGAEGGGFDQFRKHLRYGVPTEVSDVLAERGVLI